MTILFSPCNDLYTPSETVDSLIVEVKTVLKFCVYMFLYLRLARVSLTSIKFCSWKSKNIFLDLWKVKHELMCIFLFILF